MYLYIVYVHMVYCLIKLRPDLESTHQAGHFDIWFIQIGQIEVDINPTSGDLNVSILVAIASLSKWELVRTGFSHMPSRQYQK